jgi:hypothetical protein
LPEIRGEITPTNEEIQAISVMSEHHDFDQIEFVAEIYAGEMNFMVVFSGRFRPEEDIEITAHEILKTFEGIGWSVTGYDAEPQCGELTVFFDLSNSSVEKRR